MFLRKLLFGHEKEERVIQNVRRHIELLATASELFTTALGSQDRRLVQGVMDLEREGDSVRREIISNIYEGAFMPYIRPDLCNFVEILDSIFDLLEDTASCYMDADLPDSIRDDCVRLSFLNSRMCEMLSLAFEATLKGENLREKSLAIRIYEKKIDDIKFGLMKDVRGVPVEGFWQGKILSDFLAGLTAISDLIEDSIDHLQIINVSMR
jgi:hypothetical protein